MDTVPPSDRAALQSPTAPVTQQGSETSSPHPSGNGAAPAAPSTASDDGSSLVTKPTTRRKPRARKPAKKKTAPAPVATAVAVPSAPLTRPDGTPAPVI